MAAGFEPLGDDASTPWASSHRASSTVVADDMIFEPHPLHTGQRVARRQTEMEADYWRPDLSQRLRRLGAEGFSAGAGHNGAGSRP